MENRRKGNKNIPHRGRRKKKTIGMRISNIILIIAIAVLLFCAYKLFTIYNGYREGEKEYNNLQDVAIQNGDNDGPSIIIDFEELWKINQDIRAWIRFDEPSIISYPVVQGRDNEQYLHETIGGADNTMGAIFINADNNPDFTDRHTLVYGHRMDNGAMFGKLDLYKQQSFWEENPYFYIYTPDGAEIRYKIVSAGTVSETDDVYMYSFATDEQFEQFLGAVRRLAMYDTGTAATLSKDSQIVTLSTCTAANDTNRFVVCGVKDEIRRPKE